MGARSGLKARIIQGHLVATKDTLTAWYLLAPQGLSFTPPAVREAVVEGTADVYAQLVGRSLHVRCTTRLDVPSEWARRHASDSPDPSPSFAASLVRDQRWMLDRQRGTKHVFVGVQIPTNVGWHRVVGNLLGGITAARMESLRPIVESTDAVMAGAGMCGTPATPDEVEYLMRRSVGVGLPSAALAGGVAHPAWGPDDMYELTDSTRSTATPYGQSVLVSGDVDGEPVQRHVVVLAVGRLADQRTDQVAWGQITDGLPFEVEWSSRIRVVDSASVINAARHAMVKIASQKAMYQHDNGQPVPRSLLLQEAVALRVEESAGMGPMGTRTYSRHLIAVSGATEREALDRAGMVRARFGLRATIRKPAGSWAALHSFIPGESLVSPAYTRQMPVTMLGAALFAATSRIGDDHGIYLGETVASSSSNVFWAPWKATEVDETSGVVAVVAGLGGGKSGLASDVIARTTAQGVHGVVFDPSGMMTALCDMPELRGASVEVDLSRGEPGTLNPYAIIPDPVAAHFASDADFVEAKQRAEDTRRMLARTTLTELLPDSYRDNMLCETALSMAVDATHAACTSSLTLVTDVLPRVGLADESRGWKDVPALHEVAFYLSQHFAGVAKTPQGRLFMPGGFHRWSDPVPPLLTVYSLRGLALPDAGVNDLTYDQRLSLTVLNLAAWLAQRAMYYGDRNARKLLVLDEAGLLVLTPGGRDLVARASMDSRKWNTVVMVLAQQPRVLIDMGLPNLAPTVFIGRLEGPEACRDAMAFLPGVPTGVGYESVFAKLSALKADGKRGPREFVARIGSSIEVVRVHMDAHPNLLVAINTTADKAKSRDRVARAAADAVADEMVVSV